MSILSTNTKLIKVGQDYSAGSGISIDDKVISVTGEFGKTYSAGENISIYNQGEQLYISSKDWTNDIANASANAYNEAISQIPAPFDPSFISGQVDNKLDTTAFTNWQNGQYSTDLQTIEGQISNKLDESAFSQVSGSFLTAINIPESATWNEVSQAYEQASATYLTSISIPESAVWQDVSTTVQTNSAQWAEGGSGDEEVNALVHSNSGNWNTVTNKLDTSSFSTIIGNFYPASNPLGFITGVSIPESATWNEVSTTVQSNSAQWGQGGSDFDPTYMSAQIDNKLNNTEVGFRKVNSIDYVSGISGKDISAKFAGRANTAFNADHANTASYDDNGNSLTMSYYYAEEANNKANDLFNFVQSNSANWEGGSSPAGESVLFHYDHSYDPNNGSQNRNSYISGATDLYFEASVESQQGTPSDIVITRYGSEISRITWNQVSSDGYYNYFTAFYNNVDGGEIGLHNNGTEYTCYVSANGAKTDAFNQFHYFSKTSNSVNFNIQGSNITGTIIGLQHGTGTPLTSFTGSLTDFTAKGYEQYDASVNANDYQQPYSYNVSANFGEGGSSVASGDVFPPTNNLEPQTTYYLGWNANNGGLFWYHP